MPLIHNPPMSHTEHKKLSPAVAHIYILTISDTRTLATDSSGRTICDLLWAEGHQVTGRKVVRDEPDQVREAVETQLSNPDVQVIIATGGTGISSRDGTFEVVAGLLHKRLDGFGELFRMLSYEQIGPSAMLSRASAGLVAGRIVVSLPGSEAAVRLAMEKLLLPEIGHLVREATR